VLLTVAGPRRALTGFPCVAAFTRRSAAHRAFDPERRDSAL